MEGNIACTGFSGWFYFWVHEGTPDVNGTKRSIRNFRQQDTVSTTLVKIQLSV